MNTLTQLLINFSAGLVVASIVGVASYYLARWFRRVDPWLSKSVNGILIAGGVLFFNVYLIIAALFCTLGAYAERENEGRINKPLHYFFGLFSATILALSVYALLFYVVYKYYPSVYTSVALFFNSTFATSSNASYFAMFGGLLTGLLTSPSAIPIFRWLFKTSKLRPGIDRHLEQGEDTQ